jgi:hypothetical protein
MTNAALQSRLRNKGRPMDDLKRSDQIALLKTCRDYTDSGEWKGIFSYPDCGWDLVCSGLVTEDKKITTAGLAALYLMGEGDDPTPGSKSSVTLSIPLPAAV